MLEKVLDLHIHSKYSRACSPQLELPNIARACETKGIDIVASADFTHPAWFEHIKSSLIEDNAGVYRLKDNLSPTRFILGTEISCIYTHKGKVRRVHLLLLAPDINSVEKFNKALEKRGVNLKADGRPIMGLSAKQVLEIALDISPDFMMIPAHAWTPWFAVFGSKSGYDSLSDCFEELTPHIKAIETGLSSDPPMNRQLSQLDNITLVSNSDAHSLDNLGREANVLAFSKESDITYQQIIEIIKTGDKNRFLYTIEFYPQEGKYHFDGHRACQVGLAPKETKNKKGICPVCGRPLTIGVLHRVDDLADRRETDINWDKFIPHKYIVPLREIIGEVLQVGVKTKKVAAEYDRLLAKFSSEFNILLRVDCTDIEKVASNPDIALAIKNMRAGQVGLSPGYDGQYGRISTLSAKPAIKQRTLL